MAIFQDMTVAESWDFIQDDRHMVAANTVESDAFSSFTLRTKLRSNCSFCRFLFYLIRFSKKGEKVTWRHISLLQQPIFAKRVPAKKNTNRQRKKEIRTDQALKLLTPYVRVRVQPLTDNLQIMIISGREKLLPMYMLFKET